MANSTRVHDITNRTGLDTIDDIVADLRAGRMIIMMDDESRENEGDLIMAAAYVRPEDVNFMAQYGRGLICLTLTRERCRQLQLPLMVRETDRLQSTNFTVSIEAAEGITTGISAHDRAHTIKTAVAANAAPEDLRQPGHIFPLMAQPGGVLTRAGHTEAGCDLARLAELEAAAVIVEILNADGTMARRPELEIFARRHKLKIGTIADLIEYRLGKEVSVERVAERVITNEFGEFRLICYEDHVHRQVHLALVRGDLTTGQPALVRVHVQDTLRDIVGVTSERLGWPLRDAMSRVAREDNSVCIILQSEQDPRELLTTIDSLTSADSEDQSTTKSSVIRTFGIGAQILRDLGVTRMRVLSAPKQMHGISGFGLEIVEYVDGE